MQTADQFAELRFPPKGLDVNGPYTQQPKGTTALGRNVRAFDPLMQRDRGGSRSGISKYVDGQVAPGLIQELNTVAWTTSSAIGSVNYMVGGPEFNTILFPGTYVLAKVTPSGFAISTTIAVDENGNLTPGTSQDGYPVGTDLQTLPASQQTPLPTGYQVLAYWQPGVFPLSQGDWQDGGVFPGLGYIASAFPGGFTDSNFGFPGPDVKEYVSPGGVLPDGQFWIWPSGYQTIHIELNLGISHCLLVGLAGFNLASPPGAGIVAATPTLNGFTLPTASIPVSAADADPVATVFIYTDDTNPFPTSSVPFSLFGIDPDSPILQLFGWPFAGLTTFPATVLAAPTPAFATQSNNHLSLNYGIVGSNSIEVQVVVFGLFRLKKFLLPDWSLGFADLALPPFGPGLGFEGLSAYPAANFQGPSFVNGEANFGAL